MSDDGDEFGIGQTGFRCACPHCGEWHPFEDGATGRAWLTTHIQDEHPEKIQPDTEGDDE